MTGCYVMPTECPNRQAPRPSRLDRVADAVDAQRVGAAWGAWGAASHQHHQIPLIAAADVLQGRATWRTMSSVCATSGTTNVSANRPSRTWAPAGRQARLRCG